MRGACSIILVVVLLAGCATGPPVQFRPYRACIHDNHGRGRIHDPGTVLSVRLEGTTRIYSFLADRHLDDCRHVQEVRNATRFCDVTREGFLRKGECE